MCVCVCGVPCTGQMWLKCHRFVEFSRIHFVPVELGIFIGFHFAIPFIFVSLLWKWLMVARRLSDRLAAWTKLNGTQGKNVRRLFGHSKCQKSNGGAGIRDTSVHTKNRHPTSTIWLTIACAEVEAGNEDVPQFLRPKIYISVKRLCLTFRIRKRSQFTVSSKACGAGCNTPSGAEATMMSHNGISHHRIGKETCDNKRRWMRMGCMRARIFLPFFFFLRTFYRICRASHRKYAMKMWIPVTVWMRTMQQQEQRHRSICESAKSIQNVK